MKKNAKALAAINPKVSCTAKNFTDCVVYSCVPWHTNNFRMINNLILVWAYVHALPIIIIIIFLHVLLVNIFSILGFKPCAVVGGLDYEREQ